MSLSTSISKNLRKILLPVISSLYINSIATETNSLENPTIFQRANNPPINQLVSQEIYTPHRRLIETFRDRLEYNEHLVLRPDSNERLMLSFAGNTKYFIDYLNERVEGRVRKSLEQSAEAMFLDPMLERIEDSKFYNLVDDAVTPYPEKNIVQTPLTDDTGVFYKQPHISKNPFKIRPKPFRRHPAIIIEPRGREFQITLNEKKMTFSLARKIRTFSRGGIPAIGAEAPHTHLEQWYVGIGLGLPVKLGTIDGIFTTKATINDTSSNVLFTLSGNF